MTTTTDPRLIGTDPALELQLSSPAAYRRTLLRRAGLVAGWSGAFAAAPRGNRVCGPAPTMWNTHQPWPSAFATVRSSTEISTTCPSAQTCTARWRGLGMKERTTRIAGRAPCHPGLRPPTIATSSENAIAPPLGFVRRA